jgi:hypothetical protein
MSRSVARAVETLVLFRNANEHLGAKADELGVDGQRTPYLCECEDARCTTSSLSHVTSTRMFVRTRRDS